MKKLVFGLLGLVMIISCGRPQSHKPVKSEFCNDVVIKTTPVLDQGRSPLCWAYAMLATIESEHLMQGDSVHLSVDYLARMLLRVPELSPDPPPVQCWRLLVSGT